MQHTSFTSFSRAQALGNRPRHRVISNLTGNQNSRPFIYQERVIVGKTEIDNSSFTFIDPTIRLHQTTSECVGNIVHHPTPGIEIESGGSWSGGKTDSWPSDGHRRNVETVQRPISRSRCKQTGTLSPVNITSSAQRSITISHDVVSGVGYLALPS
jgi:hypothetical protein